MQSWFLVLPALATAGLSSACERDKEPVPAESLNNSSSDYILKIGDVPGERQDGGPHPGKMTTPMTPKKKLAP